MKTSRMCHSSIMIILNWRQLRINKCKKRLSLKSPYPPENESSQQRTQNTINPLPESFSHQGRLTLTTGQEGNSHHTQTDVDTDYRIFPLSSKNSSVNPQVRFLTLRLILFSHFLRFLSLIKMSCKLSNLTSPLHIQFFLWYPCASKIKNSKFVYFSPLNVSVVSLVHKPPDTEPQRVMGKFFLSYITGHSPHGPNCFTAFYLRSYSFDSLIFFSFSFLLFFPSLFLSFCSSALYLCLFHINVLLCLHCQLPGLAINSLITSTRIFHGQRK